MGHLVRVVLQIRFLIFIGELFYLFSIQLRNRQLLILWLSLVQLLLDCLIGHNAHEIIGRVAHFGALVSNLSEMINCILCFVEIDHLASGKEHEPVEDLEHVRVGLVNSLNDSFSLLM